MEIRSNDLYGLAVEHTLHRKDLPDLAKISGGASENVFEVPDEPLEVLQC
jgi:hypothetical protein